MLWVHDWVASIERFCQELTTYTNSTRKETEHLCLTEKCHSRAAICIGFCCRKIWNGYNRLSSTLFVILCEACLNVFNFLFRLKVHRNKQTCRAEHRSRIRFFETQSLQKILNTEFLSLVHLLIVIGKM